MLTELMQDGGALFLHLFSVALVSSSSQHNRNLLLGRRVVVALSAHGVGELQDGGGDEKGEHRKAYSSKRTTTNYRLGDVFALWEDWKISRRKKNDSKRSLTTAREEVSDS